MEENKCPGCGIKLDPERRWQHTTECAPKYIEIMMEKVPELWETIEMRPDLYAAVMNLIDELGYGERYKETFKGRYVIDGIRLLNANGINYYSKR